MSNNRNDMEGQEDSEYHFSDEDVSYEVESEVPKPVSSSEQGGSFISRLAARRRMFISAGVFLAIVFVVYKFVAPGSSTPTTDITAASPVAQQTPVQQPAAPAPQVAAARPQTVPVQPAAPADQSMQQQQMAAQPVQAQPQMAQQPSQTVAALPAVIPVQPAVPAGQSPAAAMGTYIENKSAELSAASQQAMSQMQAQYTQQYNEFSMQSKAMQNQIQSLSTRVADMEAQINQLVQVLTRRNQQSVANPGSTLNTNTPPAMQHGTPDVRIAYNVQAIIPGRAWLKAANGETLTVAEGDVIRDVGRVTKIDPYDGVVEITNGSKAVSLSYGNGG